MAGAADRQAALAEERAQAVLQALQGAAEAGLSALEAQDRAGIPERAVRRALERLEDRGAARRDGARWYLATPAEEAVEAADPILRADLDARIVMLPTAAHRGAAYLGLTTMAAKHHLRHERDDGWPSIVFWGPPETWKTQVGRLLSVMVGVPWTRTVRQVATQTVRSLWGRRTMGRGGTVTFARSEALANPVLTCDDVDKSGEAAVRNALWSLTLGQSVVVEEGGEQDIAPLVIVTFNTGEPEAGPLAWLHEATWRRAIMVNTWPLRAATAAMPASAGDALLTDPPRLDLRRCKPPAAKLPPDELDLLDRLLRDWCDTRKHLRISTQYLESAALGYQGLGRMPARRAVLLAALHYLEAVAPTGLAKTGGAEAVRAMLAGVPAQAVAPLTEEEPEATQEPEGLPWADLLAAYTAGYRDGADDDRHQLPQRTAERACCAVVGEPLDVAQAGRYEPETRRECYAAGREAGLRKAEAQRAGRSQEADRTFWRAEAERQRQTLRREVADLWR